MGDTDVAPTPRGETIPVDHAVATQRRCVTPVWSRSGGTLRADATGRQTRAPPVSARGGRAGGSRSLVRPSSVGERPRRVLSNHAARAGEAASARASVTAFVSSGSRRDRWAPRALYNVRTVPLRSESGVWPWLCLPISSKLGTLYSTSHEEVLVAGTIECSTLIAVVSRTSVGKGTGLGDGDAPRERPRAESRAAA